MLLDKLNFVRIFSNFEYFTKNSLPHFPEFKSVEFADKPTFDKFVQNFDTYSDFNFNSFFSWDTEHKHEVSQLNGNLILKFADYITGEAFYSLIGTKNIDNALKALLEFSQKQRLAPILKLVPEVTINAIVDSKEFIIEEDPDNFDHVFLTSELAELMGKRFKSKRHAAKKCELHGNVKITDESKNPDVTQSILEASKQWEASKHTNGKEVDMEHEFSAIRRILENRIHQESLKITFAKVDDKLVGFSIDEVLPNQFALSHYFKALPEVTGLSEYLNKEVAKKLHDQGCEYWNWEQDLGIENLQRMKISYRPVKVQKKYQVRAI